MVHLAPGRERSVLQRHPWLFSGAIREVGGNPGSGHTVVVLDSNSTPLGVGAYSPKSNIRVRLWSFSPDTRIDGAWFDDRVAQAVGLRGGLGLETNAVRLVHGEADRLPGLIVDRYSDVVVVQFLSAGAEAWREEILAAVDRTCAPRAIVERSDADVRSLEGLPVRAGVIAGSLEGNVVIEEYGLAFEVDVLSGQKTGFYLDQRANRDRVGRLSRDRDVLNAFCYSGGFTVHALAHGARQVLSVDSSEDALVLARRNVARNALASGRAQWREADVFAELRRLRDSAATFDLIILDPPKFAPTAGHVERAARAYKDINLLALKLLRPGGDLATFSCSGGVSEELFRKIVAGAAADARVDAVIIEGFGAGPDHPVPLGFPEAAYLKGLLVRKALPD